MEEKERYEIKDRWIFDTKLNKNIHSIDCYEEKNVLDIMNGQDKEIKRLAELYYELNKKYCEQQDELFNAKQENQQLKQSQNQKAIEELNNLKRYCHEWYSWSDVAKRLDEVVDDRIKELKGEVG